MKRQAEARKALNTHRINHELLHLGKIEVRASGRWRAVEILGGLIVIGLAIFALADPQFTIQTLVIVIAAGLILGGLFRITVGAFATLVGILAVACFLLERLRLGSGLQDTRQYG